MGYAILVSSGTMSAAKRKSLRDFVVDNLQCAGRQRTYFQRIVAVSKHKPNSNMKHVYLDLTADVNKNAQEEKLSGLILVYRHFIILMLEGCEVLIGNYFKLLAAKTKDTLEGSKIVLVYNNSNQVSREG